MVPEVVLSSNGSLPVVPGPPLSLLSASAFECEVAKWTLKTHLKKVFSILFSTLFANPDIFVILYVFVKM